MAAQIASRADDSATFNRALDDVNVCIGALVEHAKTWPSAALVASALVGVRDAVPFRSSPVDATAEPGGDALSGMGLGAAALSPWDDVDFARQFGLEEYLSVDWNVGRCVAFPCSFPSSS